MKHETTREITEDEIAKISGGVCVETEKKQCAMYFGLEVCTTETITECPVE